MSRHLDRTDAELNSKALIERWPITPERRQAIIERLYEIVDKSPDSRAVIAAARGLIAADRINLEQSKVDSGIGQPDQTLIVNVGGMDVKRRQAIVEQAHRLIVDVGAASRPGADIAGGLGASGDGRPLADAETH